SAASGPSPPRGRGAKAPSPAKAGEGWGGVASDHEILTERNRSHGKNLEERPRPAHQRYGCRTASVATPARTSARRIQVSPPVSDRWPRRRFRLHRSKPRRGA